MFSRKSSDPALKRQIEYLKSESAKLGAALSEITPDQEYSIRVSISQTAVKFELQIILPPDFPQVRPALRVTADLQHPLLNDRGEVVSEHIQNWNIHSNLGQLVASVLNGFKTTKPIPRQLVSAKVVPATLVQGQPVHGPTQLWPQQQQVHQGFQPKLPVPQGITQLNLSDLEKKTEAELTLLVEDQECFDDWFENLPEVKEKLNSFTRQMEQNAEIAAKILSRKEEYEKTREEMLEARKRYIERKDAFDQKYKLLVSRAEGSKDKATIRRRLKQAIDEADQDSEALANRFCEGGVPVADFVKEFREQRKLYHIRNAKQDMLKRHD